MQLKSSDDVWNTYKVSRRSWKKWTFVGRQVFNKTFEHMTKNPDLYRHPKSDMIPTEHFRTIAWNAAWMAADICSRGEKHYPQKYGKEENGST